MTDIGHLAVRQMRRTMRQPLLLLPALAVPVFFLFVTLGAFSEAVGAFGVENAANFFLPLSVLFVVMNGGPGLNLVEDIESGYFDKLLVTPTGRVSILAGSMVGDLTLLLVQSTVIVALGPLFGVRYGQGVGGAVVLVVLASLWGMAYGGIAYAIALKTGSSQATQGAFVAFFPFVFLTASFTPREALTGIVGAAAPFNPVTYLLEAMRSLLAPGWAAGELMSALLASAAVAVLTLGWAMHALRGRLIGGA